MLCVRVYDISIFNVRKQLSCFALMRSNKQTTTEWNKWYLWSSIVKFLLKMEIVFDRHRTISLHSFYVFHYAAEQQSSTENFHIHMGYAKQTLA